MTKKSKKYCIADIGYGYLKIFNGSGDVETDFSVVAKLGKAEVPEDYEVLKVDGVEYVVGESVYKLGLDPITANESANRADNIAYKVLGLYALAKGYEPDQGAVTFLTGLPYQNFRSPEEVKSVKELFQGSHIIEFKRKEIKIDIDEVLIVSQGVGACFTLSAQRPKDYLNKKMLLVDLGFNTVNYFPISGGALNMDTAKSNRDLGIQAAFKRIVDAVNIEFNANYKYYEVDDLLDNGVFQRNKDLKLERVPIIEHSLVQKEFKAYAEEVWKDIFDKYDSSELEDTEEIVFSGGTAKRVKSYLIEAKKIYCSVLDDAQEAQLQGYAEIALQRRLSRGE